MLRFFSDVLCLGDLLPHGADAVRLRSPVTEALYDI